MINEFQLKPMRIGRLLNLIRHAHGKSLRSMADEFQKESYSITSTTLHYYESGYRFPSIESSADLLKVILTLLMRTLPIHDSKKLDMDEYLQNMLDKESLYRAINECLDLRKIGLDLLATYLSGHLPKFNSETGPSLAQDVLATWYTNQNMTYRQDMALWLLYDSKFVNQNRLETDPHTGVKKMALESFPNIRTFKECSDALTFENLGPAIDSIFVFNDRIELSTSPTSDLEIYFLNAAGQSQKINYQADAKKVQKSSKNIRK